MNREISKMGSSCPDSVSFPNTRTQSSKSFEMGSKVFRFQPVRSNILLKQLLEEEEDSPKVEKKTPKHKTSYMSHRGKYANNDSFSSDSEDDKNILDKTITEDDSVLNIKDLMPGMSWLDTSEIKPLKIIAKPVPSTPMSNMFNKLSIRNQLSASKDPRSVSVDRKDERLPQTTIKNNMFKTPSCKNSRIIPSSSTAEKLQFSERSAISSTNNNISSARMKQMETATPKQKLPHHPNTNFETPKHNSILQAAIHRNFNTPRSTMLSSMMEDKIVSSSVKKSDAVLREKNFNIGKLERQRSRDIITNEEKQSLNKHSTNSERKRMPNEQLLFNEIKQPLYRQMSTSEERQSTNKQSNSNELKQSGINEERQTNKQSNTNKERRLPNKQLFSNELKQLSVNEQATNKQSNSIEIKQYSNNEEKQLKQSNISEERQLSNKQSNSNELKQYSNNEEKQFKQSSISEERQLPNKQSNSNEEKQLQNEQKNSDELKQPLIKPNVQINIPAKSIQESTFQQFKIKGKDYIIIKKIGEGGSSQVYRCLEQETLQDRAIKVVNLNVDPATRNSYINEVKTLKDLQGNNRVIRMYDFEQVNQHLFVVMEKGDVDFSIFLRSITAESQVQTHIIICYWIEMLKCVREIHKQGIIHSDLKPSNFLLVDGRLKLIDFGIASRLTAEMTSVIKNITVGTLNYISPEALRDSRECPSDENPHLRISYKSDVWSLGCILYQMVYKKTPFQSFINIWEKFAKITDKDYKIECEQISGVPLYLINMIKKCLVYDMSNRPTVEELLNMYYSGNNY